MRASVDWLSASGAEFSAGEGRPGCAHLRHYSATFKEWGEGPPLVLCAVDWVGVRNEANRVWREALAELICASGLVRRIGVNLNQAVARLNATGQRSGDLLPYAAESLRRVERLDAAAEEVRKALR